MKPENGSLISTIKNIAMATAPAHSTSAAVAVPLRGAISPKLVKMIVIHR